MINAQEKILSKISKNARFRFAGIIVQNLFFLVTALLISRILGTGSLGDFMLAIAVFQILGYASTLGMKYGTLRYVAYYNGRSDTPRVNGTILSSMVVSLSMGLILGVLLYLSAPWMTERVFHVPALTGSFRILALTLPVLALSMVIISSLQGLKAIKEKVWLENIIQPLGALCLTGLALIAGLGLTSIIGAWAVSIVVVCLCSLIYLSRICRYFWQRERARFEIKSLLSYSFPLLAVGFIYFLFTRMDILMLGYFKSSSDVGIYAIAARMAILIELPVNALNAIFEPTIAEISGRGEEKSLLSLYRAVTPWIVVIGFFIFMLLIILAGPIMELFGRNFLGGAMVLLILGLGQLINIGVGSAGALLNMTGHPRVILINTVSMICLNFALNCLLIPVYGIYGAALATAISLAAVNIFRLIEIKLILKINPFSAQYGKALSAAVISGGLIYAGSLLHLPCSSLIRSLLLLSIFCITYPLLLIGMGFHRKKRSSPESR
jgi:O-antigen/teichoic acid export membrane protein